MPRNPDKTHCTVPDCRNWAVRGSDPPLCSPHSGRAGAPPANQNHLIHGFYATVLRSEDLADLADHAGDTALDAEIVIIRVALRRIMRMLATGLAPGPDPTPLDALDYARLSGLAFQGAATVCRLLRARKDLGGEQDNAFKNVMDQALAGLGEEWGIEL
jgi:hypothetical protein